MSDDEIIADSSTPVENEDPTAEVQEFDEVEASRFLPSDTWETVADRLGVHVDDLFAWNTGLGGAFSRNMVPVGQHAQNLDKVREAETSRLNAANAADAEASKTDAQRAAEAAVDEANRARIAYETALAAANEATSKVQG